MGAGSLLWRRGARHPLRLARLWQLCVWASAWLYVSVRRRSFLASSCVLTVALVSLLVRWGVVCVNMQAWWHVHRVCLEYTNREVEGSMCAPLCRSEGIDSLSCQKYYMGKEAVFAANWDHMDVVFKSPKRNSMANSETLFWIDDNSLIHYPDDAEFMIMIKDTIKIKFNIIASDSLIKNMSRFHYGKQNHTSNRFTEQRNLWFLMQDNEYLAMVIYEQYDLFPKLLGSCGPFYTMQRMKTITTFSHLLSADHGRIEWQRRVRIALLILDFLADLESKPPEALHICDIKLNHFGMTDTFDKVKYLDLDTVHPRSIINKMTASGRACIRDSDCDFFDCRSFCNRASSTCSHPVANNNLQIVCEKILLGWAMPGLVLVPGLLLGPHSPRVLTDSLKSCANPSNEPGTARAPASRQHRTRIYNILVGLKTS